MTAVRLASAFGLALLLAAPSAAELAPFDGPRAASLAKQLVAATGDLYDAFFKQPRPPATPRSNRDYDRLKRDIRRIRNQARGLAADLARGEDRAQTLAAFESLMSSVRWARERARSVFTTQDVEQRAAAARAILDQLAPYYDPDAPAPR